MSSLTILNMPQDASLGFDPLLKSHQIMSPTQTLDLETQAAEKNDAHLLSPQTESEYGVPTEKKLAYLCVYFLLNVSLTIYSKAVLRKVLESSPSTSQS
jgi:hypothetical protein